MSPKEKKRLLQGLFDYHYLIVGVLPLSVFRSLALQFGVIFFNRRGRRPRRPVYKNHCVLRGRPLVAPTDIVWYYLS